MVAQRSASYASLAQQAQSKPDHQVSAAWEEEADRNAPATAPAVAADGPARAGSGGADAPPVTAAPRRIGIATPGSSVQTALPKRSAEETPPASADASAAAFPAAVGRPSVAAAAALVGANQHLSTPTEGGVGDFLQQLMPRPQPSKTPKEMGPPSLQQTRQVKPPRPQPKSSSDSSSGAEQSVLRPATPLAPQRVVPASQQAQPQLAGEVCSAQPVPAARTGAEPSSGVALPRQEPASSQVAEEDENPAMVLPMGTLRPNGKNPQSSLLAAAAAKRPAFSQPQPPPPPTPRPGAVSGAPPTRALSPAELAWVSKMQQSALVTPPRLAHAPAGGSALLPPPPPPPSPATAEAAQKQGQAGVEAQESGRALVTPPRGADAQSRDRSTNLPPPRLPTVSQQTPQPPPSPLQEAQHRATAPLSRAEGLQRGPSAAVLTPQQAPAPRQPEPRQLQGFQVKLSSAGVAAAAAAARQLQPQSRAPIVPPRNVAAAQQTPEERLLAQRQPPPPPVPARRSVPAAQPSSSIAMTIGVSSARPAVQPGPARDADSRGQLAEEARSGASSGSADPAKVRPHHEFLDASRNF